MDLKQATDAAVSLLAEFSVGATGSEAYRAYLGGDVLSLAERGTYPTCLGALVAGSVRRCAPEVKDLELLLKPRSATWRERDDGELLDREVHGLATEPVFKRLLDAGTLKRGERWGQRWRQGVWNGVPVDFFLVQPPAQWGVAVTLRTGPAEFSRAFVTHLRRVGYRCEKGRIMADGESAKARWKRYDGVVPTPHERDCFRHTGIPWVPVEDRALLPGETVALACRRWGWS